jgi:ABC-2 type transport system ATP-binding protein
MTGFKFVCETVRLHGVAHGEAKRLAEEAIARVNLSDAAGRNVEGYSKGMRQRIRLAQAIAHHPQVLVLDEPLNGLDPMARAESIALFESLGSQGMHVLISSHILHEVDRISDRVVLMSSGYVVAEGNIHNVRSEMQEHPMQVMVRCSNPAALASQFFQLDSLVEARLDNSGETVFFRTRDANKFYLLLNQVASAGHIEVESVSPADDDVRSLYQYLISNDGAQE